MKLKPYPKYKPAGFQWLEKIPSGWELNRLKYVSTCNDETLSEKTDPDYEIEYVDISSVSLRDGIQSTEIMSFKDAPSRARRIVRDGDSIISTVRTYLRAIAAIKSPPENLIVSTGFAVLRPAEFIDPSYLSYYVQSQNFVEAVVAYSKGVSYPAINPAELLCLYASHPKGKEEQFKIARYLDRETGKIDELVAEKEAMLGLLEEKRQAIITDAVTGRLQDEIGLPNSGMVPSGIDWLGDIPKHWKVLPIKRVSSKIGSGKTPRGGAEVYQEEGIYFLRSMNVHFSGLRLDDVVFIPEDVHKSMRSSRVLPEDVLLNITGASIGRVALVPTDFPEANVSQHVCIVRPRKNVVEPGYLSLVMASGLVQSQIKAFESGSSREGLNFQQAGGLLISMPDQIEEQRQIVECINEKMEKLNGLVAEIESAIELLKEHRTALVTAAVTGQIDVSACAAHADRREG